MKKAFILVFLLLGMASSSTAHRFNAWFKGVVNTNISTKWNIANELQYRRQNNYDNSNPFSRPLLYSYRAWVTYAVNGSVSVAVSPFAYFRHEPVLQKFGDEFHLHTDELRFAAAIDLSKKLNSRIHFQDRVSVEERLLSNDVDRLRMRNRLSARYDVSRKVGFRVSEEIFLNTINVDASHIFDQHRLDCLLIYSVSDQLRIETGYLNNTRKPANASAFLYESDFIFNLFYSFSLKRSDKSH
jgi:hypothetical protein